MRRSGVLAITLLGVLATVTGLLRRKTPSEELDADAEASAREDVVRLALSELDSTDSEKYWREVLNPLETRPEGSWCGAFVLWVLRTLGLTRWTYDRNGSWFYQLPWTKDPKPGDLAFIQDWRHLAIVASVPGDGTVQLVNGAGGGNKVTTSVVPIGTVTEFRSIAPLLAEA